MNNKKFKLNKIPRIMKNLSRNKLPIKQNKDRLIPRN